MHTAHHAQFLAKFAPFDALEPAELASIAASAQERVFEPGTAILVEDGPPAEHLGVVREGSVELVHDGEAVDRLGPRETFARPSPLSGPAPPVTVPPRWSTRCLLIP